MRKGVLYALSSYILWGFLPIYMKALAGAGPLEILAHRVIWALLLLGVAMAMSRQWGWLGEVLRNRRIVLTFCVTALLLSINWLTYIWSVVHNHIVDGTLGYFMTPLVNVLLGVVILRERLRPGQVAAIAVAVGGVLYLTINSGVLPWVGLTLAFSFSGYALLRKVAELDSAKGLTLETLFLSIPGLFYLFYLEGSGNAHFIHSGWWMTLLLLGAGAITAAPLLLFAAGARRISLTTLGVLQYTAPTIQFLIAVYLYGEALTPVRLVGFGLIWLALLIYLCEGIVQNQRQTTLRYAS
jgi:chloramphenicol-sensitive protein RarD